MSRLNSATRDTMLARYIEALREKTISGVNSDIIRGFQQLRYNPRNLLNVDSLPDRANARYNRSNSDIDVSEAFSFMSISLVSNPEPSCRIRLPEVREPITVIGINPLKENIFDITKAESKFRVYGVK